MPGKITPNKRRYTQDASDRRITYGSNLLDSFPRLVLILLVVAAFKPNIYYIMLVVGYVFWRKTQTA